MSLPVFRYFRTFFCGALFAAVGISCSAVWGELFVLQSGGEIRGKLLNPDESPRTIYDVRTDSGGRIRLAESQVIKVLTESAEEAAYAKIRPTYPDTVEGHQKLADWCQQQGLSNQRKRHLERILELEPERAEARAALGYRKVRGQWMTRDEEMAAQGLQFHTGRYRTAQEIELIESKIKRNKAEKEWFAQIKMWRAWLDKPNKTEQAQANISEIRNPYAVRALAQYIEDEPVPAVRQLYMDALAAIGTPAAINVLVTRSLVDVSEELRLGAIDHVVRSGRRDVIKQYIKELANKSNPRVNRAAVALRELDDSEAISPLIDALITTHRYKVPEGQAGQISTGFSPDGRSAGLSAGSKGPTWVTEQLRNPEVLAALIKLTDGVNFDYDELAWKAWYTQHRRSAAGGSRRD